MSSAQAAALGLAVEVLAMIGRILALVGLAAIAVIAVGFLLTLVHAVVGLAVTLAIVVVGAVVLRGLLRAAKHS